MSTVATALPSASRDANIDPITIMRIKDLQLRARAVVEGFMNGLHRSPYHGFSVEFSEYRPYTLGDDPRGLDWKLYARSDRYFVKRFEDETNRRCYLVVDQSQSMGFGSLEYTKSDYARTLAATLAYYLSQQRDGVGLLTFGEVDRRVSASQASTWVTCGKSWSLCLVHWRATSTDVVSPLDQIARLVAKRGLVILISDLLVPTESLQSKLSLLRSRGHEVMILRTLDPQEVAFHLDAPGLLVDMETGRELYIDPTMAAKEYKMRFESHQNDVKSICDTLGIDLFQVVIDRPLQASLFDVLSAQQHRGRVSSRTRSGS
jgi:uncharacterized protein (DUF58 family)